MSDLENSTAESDSSSSEDFADGEVACGGEFKPYEDEPLAHQVQEKQGQEPEARIFVDDEDGISPETLVARSSRTVTLDSWLVNLLSFNSQEYV